MCMQMYNITPIPVLNISIECSETYSPMILSSRGIIMILHRVNMATCKRVFLIDIKKIFKIICPICSV